MRLAKSHFHFIGIGGIGMCGLAELLCGMGAAVSGSDMAENANTERLKSLGAKIYLGHAADQLGKADVVVFSSAVAFNNPEIAEARKRGVPLIQRAEALAEVMRLKRGIAVAGTHGKTTTTSLTSAIFLEAKLNPTIFVGGRLDLIGSTAKLGDGEWLIAEADESDGSFLKLSPELGIITNIDTDHLDYHKSFENLQRAYYEFALKLPFYGHLIACGDDPAIRQTFENYPKRISYYGFDSKNDYFLKGGQGHYQVFHQDRARAETKEIAKFELSVPGQHNALNALAAFLAGRFAGVPLEVCSRGLKSFQGVDRRFQLRGQTSAGVLVYDDYGHHPTEIRATLQAFREKFASERLIAVFQPHRFSRTSHCWTDFTQAFGLASEVIVTDIYAAGEAPIAGISSERLALEMKHDSVTFLSKDSHFTEQLHKRGKKGDVLIFLGAGDIYKTAIEMAESSR